MQCGIVGPPVAGKSTLFDLLTGTVGGESAASRRTRLGIAKLEDPRLELLGKASASRKLTPATVEYVDIPGIKSKGDPKQPYPAAYLSELRATDMLALVVREFDDPSIPHPLGSIDPARDIEEACLEFIISDISTVERRLERLGKMHDAESITEARVMDRCLETLSDEEPLRELSLDRDEQKILSAYSFLSLKPLLFILNLGETSARDGENILAKIREATSVSPAQTGWVTVAAGIETEINQLDETDRQIFMNDLGFKHTALDRIIKATNDLLGLITYFTTGDKESRAWTIPRGSTALKAADNVHSDLARGFIRAETCQLEEYLEAGSYPKLKESGKLRLEGRDYIVQEADLLLIRFNV